MTHLCVFCKVSLLGLSRKLEEPIRPEEQHLLRIGWHSAGNGLFFQCGDERIWECARLNLQLALLEFTLSLATPAVRGRVANMSSRAASAALASRDPRSLDVAFLLRRFFVLGL